MRHLTFAQIACGSAMVIALTFVALFLAPEASGPAVALIAVAALVLGAVTAVVVRARGHAAAPVRRPAPATPERPGARV
ncbi:hypothetical protein [Streptomyces sp. NBC_01803]|uniref:hypothetical protein n=1 Tax=Streptomyces sp. NBC_01803 TaxID=2975946 RepID=UPI002DD802D6|nr:hypothetical protein [Streptomyces sp. NBC_01803]WSA44398.1 hypothetical protein OIE51_09395 [Streptomyces sp. NBC_01803]